MSGRIRALDWSTTPLGPIASWSPELKTAVDIGLASAFPTFIWWGDDLVQIYNDAAIAILRAKHPDALGHPARVVWADVWPDVGPMFAQVLTTGQPYLANDLALLPERGGATEPAYFTFCYSVVRGAGGEIAGMQAVAIETTPRVVAERNLQVSAARFRAMVTATSYAIYRMNADWSEMRQLDGHGFVADTAQPSREWLDTYILADDRAEVLAAIAEAIRSRGIFTLEHRVRRVDGSTGWTLSRAVPMLDERGEITEWFGAAADVTAKHTAEEALRQSEERYRALFESIDEGFVVSELLYDESGSPVDLLVLETNASFERLMQTTNSVGKRAREIFPDAEASWFEAYERVVSTGEPLRFENYLEALDRWFDLYIARIGDAGSRRFAIVFNDITERRRAEVALRASENKYSRLFESIDEGFCTIEVLFDAAGRAIDYRFLEVNPAFERATGLVNAQGRLMSELAPKHEQYWYDIYGRIAQTGIPERFEQSAAALGRWYSVYAIHVGNPGQHQVAVLFQDISDRKQAETEREDLLSEVETERETLAHRVADSTRTQRELSRRLLHVQEEERRHLARELHDEIGQSLTALQFRLATARRESGDGLVEAEGIVSELTSRVRQLSVELRPAALDTLGLLPALLWHVERYQANTGIRVDFRHLGIERRFAPEIEITAFRIIQEGLTNIARHSDSDTAMVQLFADGVLTVVIRDFGRGFDRDLPGQTGGLSGMRERLELVQGDIQIESEPGVGTAITVEIPLGV